MLRFPLHTVKNCKGGLFINFSSYEDGTFADQIKVRSADMNCAHIPENVGNFNLALNTIKEANIDLSLIENIKF